MEMQIERRIEEHERSIRRLRAITWIQGSLLALAPAAFIAGCVTARDDGGTPRPLRVSELVVVDRDGVERVRIGGDLPDAIIGGKRVPRREKAAGVILYDRTGQERSGYVTWEPSGNVGLTLDTGREQVAFFVAGRDSGSALQLRHADGLAELRSDDDGSRFTAVRRGEVVMQEPPVVLGAEACNAYRDARSRTSPAAALQLCRQRFTDDACRSCMTGQ